MFASPYGAIPAVALETKYPWPVVTEVNVVSL